MIFEFAAKINNINVSEYNADAIKDKIAQTDKLLSKPMEIKTLLPVSGEGKMMLVKSQASVSSIPLYHDKEREEAIKSFKLYLEGIAEALGGSVSIADGFYNDSRTFSRLYI